MAISPIQLKPKVDKGGGLLGKITGGVLGAVGGAVAGGPAGALKGASLGSTAGQMIGGAVDPGGVKEMPRPTGIESEVARRPEITIATLEEAVPMIAKEPEITPQEADDFIREIRSAQDVLRKRIV